MVYLQGSAREQHAVVALQLLQLLEEFGLRVLESVSLVHDK